MATKKKQSAVQTLTLPERVVTVKKKAQVVYRPWSNKDFGIRFNRRLNEFEETDGLTSLNPQWRQISWSGLNGETDTPADYVKHLRNLVKLIQETK